MSKNIKLLLILLGVVVMGGMIFLIIQPDPIQETMETEQEIIYEELEESFHDDLENQECGIVTFTYKEQEVTYGSIKSPNTGKCWLDRNLGAERSAITLDDEKAYGDLFQWGRLDDGHQERNSETTTNQATDFNPGHNSFITENSNWLSYQDSTLWQEDNPNNPCPDGWRVPTSDEWSDEISQGNWETAENAFSDLKLTLAGFRIYRDNGLLLASGDDGHYWSSTFFDSFASYLDVLNDSVEIGSLYPSNGLSVRCIEN